MPEEGERRRRWRRLVGGLLGPSAFKPGEPPTELKTLRKSIHLAFVLWMAGVVLLGSTLGDSPAVGAFGVVGWLVLMVLTVRYFLLFFKKGG